MGDVQDIENEIIVDVEALEMERRNQSNQIYTARCKLKKPETNVNSRESSDATKQFQSRYLQLQNELRLRNRTPLQSSLAPNTDMSSLSSSVKEDDTKMDIRLVLGRMRKDRLVEKIKKEKLMKYAISPRIPHDIRPSLRRPTKVQYSERRKSIASLGSSSIVSASSSGEETMVEIPTAIKEKVAVMVCAYNFGLAMFEYLQWTKNVFNQKVLAARKILRLWRRHRLGSRCAVTKTPIYNVALPFILAVRKRIKCRSIDKLKVFFAEFARQNSPSFLIKVFLGKIRRVQRSVRGYLAIQCDRLLLLERLWDRVEEQVRSAHYERVQNNIREQNERLKITLIKQLRNRSGIASRWQELHQQVVLYSRKINEVHVKFKKVNYVPRGEVDPDSSNANVVDDSVSIDIKRAIIAKAFAHKRKEHIRNLCAIQEAGYHEHIDEKLVQNFLKGCSTSTKKITNLQLKGAELYSSKMKYQFSSFKTLFLCLTGPNLGKSWKVIIREAVEDNIRKKEGVDERSSLIS